MGSDALYIRSVPLHDRISHDRHSNPHNRHQQQTQLADVLGRMRASLPVLAHMPEVLRMIRLSMGRLVWLVCLLVGWMMLL